jgi:hypothetical protein
LNPAPPECIQKRNTDHFTATFGMRLILIKWNLKKQVVRAFIGYYCLRTESSYGLLVKTIIKIRVPLKA